MTLAKPRPKLLDKRNVAREVAKIDRDENLIVKLRSQGQCEVVYVAANVIRHKLEWRCAHRGAHIHHLISGIGRRNRGISILAEHKLHVCAECHMEIHGHVLKPVNATEREDAATVRYERVV